MTDPITSADDHDPSDPFQFIEIVDVPIIGRDPSIEHEYELQLTPPLNENDGKGEYRLPEAVCKCGWWKPAKTVEQAVEFGEYHCGVENRKPKGYE